MGSSMLGDCTIFILLYLMAFRSPSPGLALLPCTRSEVAPAAQLSWPVTTRWLHKPKCHDGHVNLNGFCSTSTEATSVLHSWSVCSFKNDGLQFVIPRHKVQAVTAVMAQKPYHNWESIPCRLLSRQVCLLTCFRGKWDWTRATHFQGKCHVHCTSGATTYKQSVSSVDWKRGKNKSFVSL
jgi:hypothetical protein